MIDASPDTHLGSTRGDRPSRLARLAATALLLVGLATAQTSAANQDPPAVSPSPLLVSPATAEPPTGVVQLHNRSIITLRAKLRGDGPQERALMASRALEAAAKGGRGVEVARVMLDGAVRFDINGAPAFFLVPDDLGSLRTDGMLAKAAQDAEVRLRIALDEAVEMTDPERIAIGFAYAAAATAVALLLLRLLLTAKRRAIRALGGLVGSWQDRQEAAGVLGSYAEYVRSVLRLVVNAGTWFVILLLLDLWATFTLRQFAWTRPWGERSTTWLLDLVQGFALAIGQAIPGLLTAVLIFAMARVVTRAIGQFVERVERGELRPGWLDADTAGPTRRLGNAVIWLFALAMAYPYLPGSGSESFKGVSVLAGLMLSLGASGVVGQAMSGLSLMYSGAIRMGEFVRVGDMEGTVAGIGMFATRLHTGNGEEVILPNAVLASQPLRNLSRRAADGGVMLHTTVTIGYSTPWRQVHGLLIEAAGRTPAVVRSPPPFVAQTALSDFYVEYRLCAQCDASVRGSRTTAMTALLANIQDVFNENGVQIMSPHYEGDPEQPVVAPVSWPQDSARKA